MENRIEIIIGDIAKQKVDAIVNSSNEELIGYGGVDLAIHLVAGPKLAKACKRLGGCKPGEAKLTAGYSLPAKYVIHTVGPRYGREDGKEEKILESAYWSSLVLAEKHKIKSVAFPLISTGVFGYPVIEAFEIAQKTILQFFESHPKAMVKEIKLVIKNCRFESGEK